MSEDKSYTTEDLLLFIDKLRRENQQLKEVINKAIEYINNNYPLRTSFSKNIYDFKIEIKKILTGDSNE